MSAIVIEGVCRSRNALLNGDTSNYDWDSGYTCHQLGSGAIVVQLAQPYAISSMRFLFSFSLQKGTTQYPYWT
jgi:BTB/POZ domain-containing protein 9